MKQMRRSYDRPMFDLPEATSGRMHRKVASKRRTISFEGDLSTPQQLVLDFHRTFGLPFSTSPTLQVCESIAELRNSLLREEAGELMDACERRDLVAIADGIADVLYVVYGTAVTYGLDADALLREVHRSNMSKLGADGKPILRDDGKVVKGPNFFKPNFEMLLGSSLDAACLVGDFADR